MPPQSPTRPEDTVTLSVAAVNTAFTLAPPPSFLDGLIDRSVVLPEEWDELDPAVRAELHALDFQSEIVRRLLALHLITPFQADLIRKGRAGDLVLGQYRVLGLLGKGGMGVVYRAENTYLRREVALKVFVSSGDSCVSLRSRFYTEARAAARLRHPNLVPCLDAGRQAAADGSGNAYDYYVMDLVTGSDLHATVAASGPLPAARACDLFRQVADALAEAHRHGLIHRDVKPSNVVVTPDWQAKLLDFGLALHPHRRVTVPGTLLGTIGYMAPEQARDPQTVDARADLFGLGATMYWALTGREPFASSGNPLRDLRQREAGPPPDIRCFRPEVSEDLAALVARMLAADPDQRPPTARVVAISLAALARPAAAPAVALTAAGGAARPRVVLVDDEVPLRQLQHAFLGDEFAVEEAGDGPGLMDLLRAAPADLVVLDVNLPGVTGDRLVDAIVAASPDGCRPMILLTSGAVPPEFLGGLLAGGADDFLPKPFTRAEFRSRVRALLGRRAGTRDRQATETVRMGVEGLTRTPPGTAVVSGGDAAGLAEVGLLARVFARVASETLAFNAGYPDRLGRYVRAIAAGVRDAGEYARLKDERYVGLLAAVAPLHDLGMMAVPPATLRKPSPLTAQERLLVQTHPVVGSEWVLAAAAAGAGATPAVALAAEVVRGHHERWDGAGYPDAVAGDGCPLSARVVGLASVYDALRSPRGHRPAMTHARATRLLVNEAAGQFDPVLLHAFATAAGRFETIFKG